MTPAREEDFARMLSNQRSRIVRITNRNTYLEQCVEELTIEISKLKDHIDASNDELEDLNAQITELTQY